MQETRGQSWGQEDPLEKETATHSAFLPGKSHGQRSLAGSTPWGRKRVRHDLVTKHQRQPLASPRWMSVRPRSQLWQPQSFHWSYQSFFYSISLFTEPIFFCLVDPKLFVSLFSFINVYSL